MNKRPRTEVTSHQEIGKATAEFLSFMTRVVEEKKASQKQLMQVGIEAQIQKRELARLQAKIMSQSSIIKDRDKEIEQYKMTIHKANSELQEFKLHMNELSDELESCKSSLELVKKTVVLLKETAEIEERSTEQYKTKLSNAESVLVRAQSEINRLNDAFENARSNFTDCITLDINAACIPTTSGQVSVLIGVMNQFLLNYSIIGDKL